jgi:excisionase family DNA binding protein
VSILRLGGRRIDHERANCRGRCPGRAHGVEEAAAALRLSRSVLYELVRPGQLRTVKQGRRRLVPGQFRGCRLAGFMPMCTRRCADVITPPPAAESQRATDRRLSGTSRWSSRRRGVRRRAAQFVLPNDQLVHGGHGLNVEELHLAYVSKGVRVHRSSRAAMSPLGGSVSGALANEGEV